MKEDSMRRMMADVAIDRERDPAAFSNDRWEREDEDDGDDEDADADDADLIDRSECFSLL